jgi:rubrerythrin
MDNRELARVIELAIKKEEEARAFYLDLYEKVEDELAKDTLKYLADEEAKHAEYLTTCMAGRYCSSVLGMTDVVDYKVIEHLEKPDIDKDMSSADVYLVAAQRELDAYNFYKSLADSYPPGDMKDLLTRMANQEKKHKEKVEYLYDNTAFPQTSGG